MSQIIFHSNFTVTMGQYESKIVNIIPGRTGSVFGPSKLLLEGGSLRRISGGFDFT
jgi:hypothetical protein